MHRASRLKKILSMLLAAVLAAGCYSCGRKLQHPVSMGEWIAMIASRAGYESSVESAPYYASIPKDSIYFKAVQSSVDWGVLESSVPFDVEDSLSREWAAYTLINLSGSEAETTDSTIRDIAASRFQKQVSAAVSSGLMPLDKNRCFHPKQLMEKQEAGDLLDQTLSWMDQRTIQNPHSEIDWSDDVDVEEEMPDFFDEDTLTASFPKEASIYENEIVHWEDESGEERWYRAKEKVIDAEQLQSQSDDSGGSAAQKDNFEKSGQQNSAEKNVWKMEEVTAEDIFSHIDLSNSFTVDFSKAEIFDPISHERINPDSSSLIQTQRSVQLFSPVSPLTSIHEFDGCKVKTTISDSSIRAEVTRKLDNNTSVTGTFSISSIKPTYDFDATPFRVKKGYYTVSWNSSESLKIKYGSHKKATAVFQKTVPEQFFTKLREWYGSHPDSAELVIPLAQVKIPVPDAPLVYLNLNLSLKISATGKAELSLSQAHEAGMEIRDGSIRPINNHNSHAEAILQGDTGLRASASMGIDVGPVSMADLAVEAGATADVSATLHLYDKDGKHSVASAEGIPADLVEDAAEKNDNVLVCADVDAHWVLSVEMNSGKTLCSRFGFNKKWDILTKDNNELIPGLSKHYENWQAVQKCTRKDREAKKENLKEVDSSSLKLQDQLILLSPGLSYQLQVLDLPSGVRKKDLKFASSSPSVASVSSDGVVTAHQDGSATITVSTLGKYSAMCTVSVNSAKKT